MDHPGEKQTAQLRPEMYYEEEIDLRDLLLVLWRYRKMILGIFLAAVITAAVVSFLLPPVYEIKSTISLGTISIQGTSTNQPAPILSPAVAKEMLLGDDLFREAVEDAGLNLSDPLIRSCKEGLKVETVKDTNLVQITMETRDPAKGREILDKMVAIFARKGGEGFNKQRELTESELKRVKADLADVEKNINSTKDALTALAGAANGLTADLQRARLLDALSRFQDQREMLLDKKLSLEQSLSSSQGIEVIEKPAIPTAPVRPRKKLNIAVAGVLGLMVGVFAAFTLDYFRRNPLSCNDACA